MERSLSYASTTLTVKTPGLWTAMPYRDRNGRVRTQQYPHCIMQYLHNEASKHGVQSFVWLASMKMRPSRVAFLKKLDRYRRRVTQ